MLIGELPLLVLMLGGAVGAIVHLIRRDTLYKSANRRVERLEVVDLCVNQPVSRVDGVDASRPFDLCTVVDLAVLLI